MTADRDERDYRSLLRHRADALMSAFRPVELPLVERASYLGIGRIKESLTGPITRTICLIAPGGYGKTVLLGELYLALREKTPWIGLLRGSDISLPEDMRLLGAEIARALIGSSDNLKDLVRSLTRAHGRGLIIIDGFDRLLSPLTISALHDVLSELAGLGTTVGLACRDYEYASFVEPVARTMPRVAETFQAIRLPLFEFPQVRSAVDQFIGQLSGVSREQGQKFAETVLALRFDNYPLAELTRIPLLLSLLCRLYGPQGYIPADLTVTSLWSDYWEKRVRNTALSPSDLGSAMAREDVCFQIAAQAIETSRDRLIQFVHDRSIVLNAAAVTQLLSEGVLINETSDTLGFFHQTLLEYAIARWLRSSSGHAARARLLGELTVAGNRGSTTPLANFYWPVARQFIAICEKHLCQQVLSKLDWRNFQAARAVVYGMVARGDPQSIHELASEVLKRPNHQRIFLDAVRSVDAKCMVAAWDTTLDLVENGEERNAEVAVETLAALTERTGAAGAELLNRMIDLLSKRQFAASNRDLNFLSSRFIQYLLDHDTSVPEPVLEALTTGYEKFSSGVQSQIIHLQARQGSERTKRLFFDRALSWPLAPEAQGAMVQLVEMLVPPDAILPELAIERKKGWSQTWALVLGVRAARNSSLIGPVVDALRRAPAKSKHKFTEALCYAIERGGALGVLAELENISFEIMWREGGAVHVGELVEVLSGNLVHDDVTRARTFAAPSFGASDARSLGCRLCLWRESDDTAGLFTSLQGLTDAQFQSLLLRVVGRAPPQSLLALFPDIRVAIQERRYSLNDVLAAVLARVPEAVPDAVGILVDFATGPAQRVALSAAKAIHALAVRGWPVDAKRIGPLATARVSGVQQHWSRILKLIFEKADIDENSMIAAAQAIARESADEQARIVLLELLRDWIRRHNSAPAAIVQSLRQMVVSISNPADFKIGHITTLKAIAEFADQSEVPALGDIALLILAQLDLNRINIAEHEMSDVLQAVGRRDRRFLKRLLARFDMRSAPWRNARAVAFAVRALDGNDSLALRLMDSHPACPASVRELLAEWLSL